MSETALDSAPQPAQPGTSDDGVIRLGGGAAEQVPTKPLFAIDGTTYKIPTKIRPNLALKIMAKFESDGPVAAEIYMLRAVLGTAAFEALMNYEALTEDDLKAITDKVTTLTFSSVEEASGK